MLGPSDERLARDEQRGGPRPCTRLCDGSVKERIPQGEVYAASDLGRAGHLDAPREASGHVEVVDSRVGAVVIDQVAKVLIEIGRTRRHRPTIEGPLESRFPADGMLGSEIGVAVYEARRKVLIERRLFEGRPKRSNHSCLGIQPNRRARAVRRVPSEPLVVIEADPERRVQAALRWGYQL